jgi:hypothetical protein
LPLKFPLKTNDPACDAAEVKQPVETVKVRFVPVTTLPLLWVKEVANAKAGMPSVLVKFAVQWPVRVFALELPPPHAAKIRPTARKNAPPNCFINHSSVTFVKTIAPAKAASIKKTNLQTFASDDFPTGIDAARPKRETPSRRLSVAES